MREDKVFRQRFAKYLCSNCQTLCQGTAVNPVIQFVGGDGYAHLLEHGRHNAGGDRFAVYQHPKRAQKRAKLCANVRSYRWRSKKTAKNVKSANVLRP